MGKYVYTVVFIHPTLSYIMEWLAILSYRTLGMSGCGLSLGQTLTYVTDFISHTTVQHYSAKASVLKCMPTAVQ